MKVHIDVYHHFDPLDSDGANRKLDSILAQVKQLGVLMATVSEQVKKFAADLDAETNAISARIDALTKKISEGTVEQTDLDAFQAISDRLKLLGQDPTNPVPPPVN